MIHADQPTCFDSSVVAAVSSLEDGQTQLAKGEPDVEVIHNRRVFLKNVGLKIEDVILLKVTYADNRTYDIIREVTDQDASRGMFNNDDVDQADCLVTQTPGVGLFLPIADCTGTIVHDPVNNVLALIHLGRHSTTAQLATKVVTYLQEHFGSKPGDLVVWFSPSIRKESYRVKVEHLENGDSRIADYFIEDEGGRWFDMHGYNWMLFVGAGVERTAIHDADVNTATSSEYGSHYAQTTVGGELPPPRFAVVCALKKPQ